MLKSLTFQKNAFRYIGLLLVVVGLLLLSGNPLILRSQARPQAGLDPETVQQKLAELESASRQAGLQADEVKAVLELAKRAAADKLKLFQMQANGKLSDLENKALEKLVQAFGHPLEKEFTELREVAKDAGLTADETAAAQRVALQEGFDSEAILLRYECGKLSPVEKAAFEKVIALQGHPRAKEIENLTEVARQAGLSDQQLQTLRGLAARASWDLEKIKELKRTGKLSADELSAMALLQPLIARLKSREEMADSERGRSLRQLAKIADLSDAETRALLDAVKQAGADEDALLIAKRTGTLSAPAAAGLKKLEALLGKLEDFAVSPHKKEIGKLLETASEVGLTTEETGVLVKLAVRVEFDIEDAEQLWADGRLSDAEIRVLSKLRKYIGR